MLKTNERINEKIDSGTVRVLGADGMTEIVRITVPLDRVSGNIRKGSSHV